MAQEDDGCDECPLLLPEGVSARDQRKRCMKGLEYPFKLIELNPHVSVTVESEDDLPRAFSEFTRLVYAESGGSGTEVNPRVFKRAVVDGRRASLCPHSFPMPAWARLVVEQIQFDTSGMQPRLLYNNKPWVNQPAIYCECYMIVTHSKSIAEKWAEKNREREKGR